LSGFAVTEMLKKAVQNITATTVTISLFIVVPPCIVDDRKAIYVIYWITEPIT
jgi:hypothetical protein